MGASPPISSSGCRCSWPKPTGASPQPPATLFRGLGRSERAAPPLQACGHLRRPERLVPAGDARRGYRRVFRPHHRFRGFRLSKTRPEAFHSRPDGVGGGAENVLFVGNDMFRDVYAANQFGIKTVFFSSNQGSKQPEGAKPDYIIYQFPEMRQAVEFFERQ